MPSTALRGTLSDEVEGQPSDIFKALIYHVVSTTGNTHQPRSRPGFSQVQSIFWYCDSIFETCQNQHGRCPATRPLTFGRRVSGFNLRRRQLRVGANRSRAVGQIFIARSEHQLSLQFSPLLPGRIWINPAPKHGLNFFCRQYVTARANQDDTQRAIRSVNCCGTHDSVSVGFPPEVDLFQIHSVSYPPYIVCKIVQCNALDGTLANSDGAIVVSHYLNATGRNTPGQFFKLGSRPSVSGRNDKRIGPFTIDEGFNFDVTVSNKAIDLSTSCWSCITQK